MHTNELPNGSETSDAESAAFADASGYVVFKDRGFLHRLPLRRVLKKLVHIRTGNGLRD